MLLDTYGLVYRAFFALPVLTTTKGVPINAAYGFTMMLNKIVADEKPTHVVACFDRGLPQARIEMYKEYKAQRQAMPDDLRSQFALVRQVLAAYAVPIVECDNAEADDVIATLARQAEAEGQETLIVTGDLDMLQLVDARTTVLVTRRGITDLGRYDPPAVRERFGLEPLQLPDYRGLKGDPSDNLPGIPGVGEKTAIVLIQRAGSLDALLADPKLAGTPKLENLILQYGDQARVCRDVSLVRADLPLSVPWDAARYAAPPNDVLYQLYRELEFKSLLAKLHEPSLLEPAPVEARMAGAYQTFSAATDPPDFKALAGLIEAAARAPSSAIALRDGVELGISTAPGSGFSFLLAAVDNSLVKPAFAVYWHESVAIAAHDAKALLAALQSRMGPLAGLRDDTMVATHLLSPARSYAKLGDAAAELLERALPPDAAAWADATLQLAHTARATLAEREQLDLYGDVELPLVTILAGMEAAGIGVDPQALSAMAHEIDASVLRLQGEIYDLAGEEFNIGSPQQLGAILFEKLHIPSGKRNKTGWATGVEVLQALAREFPICAKVLEYREVTKLKNTYVDVLPKLVDARGRIHTVFNQTTTATGRLSSTNPNLQNVPVRGELGRRIRRAFIAPGYPERVLLAADYSQIELRLMAHLSGDAAMRRAFHEGQDIHDFTARQLFGVAAGDRASAEQRRMAKSVNFGLLYGMSDFGLAQRLEIARADAKEITTAYFARFPGVRSYIEQSLEDGRRLGYVSTILGRRRYIPDLRAKNFALRGAAEREATNAPLQGSAADLMKLAMVRIDRALREGGYDALMLLQIHDELIFEVRARQLAEIATIVRAEMEGALELSVPIEVTLKTGANWCDVEAYS